MAQFDVELFIQCVYSQRLSYHELLELELNLKVAMTGALEDCRGEYIHFEPMGDTMRVQCVFEEYGEMLFHELCERVAPLMDGDVEARLLFVHKGLEHVHFYAVSERKWQESCIALPAPRPIPRGIREKNSRTH